MTANQISALLPRDTVPTQTSQCNHNEISPGLDHIQCKNCRRCWPRWHPDYERLLNQPAVTHEQKALSDIEDCSCVPLSTPTHEPTHEQKSWVQTYWVKRNGNKHEYYRFCYLTSSSDIGSCVRRHIPGGNTKSARAQTRKQEIERAIAAGWWPSEIEELIKSWRHK